MLQLPDLDAARLEADGEEVLVAGHALELDGPRHALERQLEQQGQRRGLAGDVLVTA